MRGQSVSAALGAVACSEAISARRCQTVSSSPRAERSRWARPSAIRPWSHCSRGWSSSSCATPSGPTRVGSRAAVSASRAASASLAGPAVIGCARQRAGQPHRLDAELRLHQRLARRRRVAFVEHQVERGAHRFGALGQRLGRRRLDRDVGRFELPARAHQALGDGRRLGQQARGDLRHGEAAHGLERKGHAHLGRQRGMADGEQQRQLVVAQLAVEVAFARRAGAARAAAARRRAPGRALRCAAGRARGCGRRSASQASGLLRHALEGPRATAPASARAGRRPRRRRCGRRPAAAPGRRPAGSPNRGPANRRAGGPVLSKRSARGGADLGHVVDRPELDPVGRRRARDAGNPGRSPRPRRASLASSTK